MEQSRGIDFVRKFGHTLPAGWVQLREEDGKVYFEDGGGTLPNAPALDRTATPATPCSSCGKKVDPAQVKSSPQAIESFLAE